MASSSSFTTQTFISHTISTTRQLIISPSSKIQPPSSQQPQSNSSFSNSVENNKPLTPIQSNIDNIVNKKATPTKVETTDWIASSLTRRFGLGAGLAWVSFLAFGVVSEQIKTRLEVSQQQANIRDLDKEEEIVLPNGIRYYDMRIGGGASPRIGDLVVIDLKGSIKDSGEVFVDTFDKKNKSLALLMGSRPYTRGMCEGIEYVLKTMKAGGKRRVIVPPKLGYCDNGADFGSDVSIPPCATLEYIVEVDKVSIAPA
ncbi:peptidyl-prolyl cis-trans isomerase FKBP17-2, chloroplastic-like [Amaranthus tricolor]|uniref:peptidyl-prolyl cis-trans isomerase FKBP17-2, chloroplastic-like n=1 Tax=Amaranthus tricolor TaxID=29722 RepID=UPI00258CD57D|nr:peptidyl-prolyl cis-trans isomerase FKBP17-2, chloroplastic-like [Amaranthus tricolor]